MQLIGELIAWLLIVLAATLIVERLLDFDIWR